MNNHAKIAGILSIISGAFGGFHLIGASFSVYIFRYMFKTPYYGYPSIPPDEFITIMTIFYSAIGLFFALVGVLGIVGGLYALKKKRWGLAVAGAIAATITFFPCGIPAIIYVTLAKQDFSEPKSSTI